jgi:hypothetical protein
MILITSALVILLTAGLSLRQVRMQHGKAYVLELTPSTTLICAFTLYALALPIRACCLLRMRLLWTRHTYCCMFRRPSDCSLGSGAHQLSACLTKGGRR